MRPFRRAAWGCALVLLAAGAGDLQAAWCNVFQVTCWGCRSRPSVSAYVSGSAPSACCPPAPCCTPCPQTVCTTRYVQRCYYQPVTTVETRTYYEPVTTYRTSFFWEPVTSYRYSCHYDPCTCSYRQVACPVTSYRLRSQCCPVQSFVQRCCSVPVTSYRQVSFYEPVTSCCTTPAPAPCPPPCNDNTAPPAVGTAPPAVGEQRVTPQPGVGEYRSTPSNPAPSNPPPAGPGVSLRQLPPLAPRSLPPVAPRPSPPPTVKLERIVALPSTSVEGQVVRTDNAPQPGARLLFVSAEQNGERESVTADRTGQFRVTLASGGWLVYVEGADGKPAFHSKIDVKESQNRLVTLVSR